MQVYGEDMQDAGFTIRTMAERCGMTAHTLRYYERVGLIQPVGRARNGHRRYSEADAAWLHFLHCMRDTNMPIREMQRYAAMRAMGLKDIAKALDLGTNDDPALRLGKDALMRGVFCSDYGPQRDYAELAATGDMTPEAILAVMARYATYPAATPAPDELLRLLRSPPSSRR